MPTTRVAPKAWEATLSRRWNIHPVSLPFPIDNCLFVTRCSRCKSGVARGRPHELYAGVIPQFFFRAMNRLNLRYAVLSDKYGLHMDTEILESYDMHPRELNDAHKLILGNVIKTKTLASGKTKIVFYNNSPVRSTPYFQMLSHTELETYFCTRLTFVENRERSGRE